MKKVLLFLIVLLPLTVQAYDFQVVVPGGQTLYFDTVAGGVSVVYPRGEVSYAGGWNGFDKPVGALAIPSTVHWNGITWPVVSIAPGAFYNCTGITAVVVGQGVATIGNNAFRKCSGMDSVMLPASVVSIGIQAFGECSSLSSFWIHAAVPPTTLEGVFFNTTLSSCVLHVPCESAGVYLAALPWSSFGSVLAMPCAVTFNVGVNNGARGSATGTGTYPYGTQVMLEAMPADGYAFICWNDGDTLNPRLIEATADSAFTAMFFALIHDTIDHTPAFFRLQVLSDNSDLGLGVGSALLADGTVAEICALPLDGGRFIGWDDGATDNPRHVTVNGDRTLTALFDRVSVTCAEAAQWSISPIGKSVTVNCPEGSNVSLYDASGRTMATARADGFPLRFDVPSAGVYVVSVGGLGARKVVVE